MKQIVLLLAAVFIIITVLGVLNKYPNASKKALQNPGGFIETAVEKNVYKKKEIKIADKTLLVEVVDSLEARNKGLSGREGLEENRGMLFVFETKDVRPGFWMKDMRFSIDIIWINDDKVVQISKELPYPSPDTPDRSLPIYTPQVSVDYVLEVSAGFSDKNGISVGDSVDLSSALGS
jgi:uncharacterized membrane protein (UPF0127 family)